MKRKIAISLLLPLLLVSCTDNDLATVAKSLNAAAKSLSIFQSTIVTLNQSGKLSDPTTRSLMNVSLKINEAGVIASTQAKQIATLTPADRKNLLNILTPIIKAIDDAVLTDVIPIADPKTKQEVQLALMLVETDLNAARLALEAH